MNLRHAVVALAFSLSSLAVVNAESPKDFKFVPARLSVPRDGLGNVFAKLQAANSGRSQREIRIAYFGGSITAQAGWRVKTLKWLQEKYPQANISEINAAIGGTGSGFGVYRFYHDVLRHKPDLIFVEFSVNDGGTPPADIWRSMEGIIRQTWKMDPSIDICYVYTFRVGYEKDLDEGNCPQAASADEFLADYYGIPSINMAMRTAELAREKKLLYVPMKDEKGNALPTPEGTILFSTDGVHPLDAGHTIYTQVITDALEQWESTPKREAHTLKVPMMPDNWESAKLVPLEPWMLSAGWKKLSPTEGLAASFNKLMPEVWEATRPGETISFKFKGTAVSLYDLMGPDGAQVVCTLDGKTGLPRPRFDWYCTYWRPASVGVGQGLDDTVHTVSVEIHPDQPDRSPVTNRVKDQPNHDPKKYDGTVLRVGWIMVIGDVVRE
ncbi:MAG: acyl-CoA thioesterase [Armatimonadetes bacterium CG_4_10_14_3_um_filter_59_10]|nr:MAG: acyl-CoA thioesterase [Armatimonadetes bacterium CG_4_10_14_3_um_filter_59_10]PJB78604.1 MAG: acyl-CoA thioesterase [Armatimonadetes bacterium CG_4_9_14_3_um_filter_58_7]